MGAVVLPQLGTVVRGRLGRALVSGHGEEQKRQNQKRNQETVSSPTAPISPVASPGGQGWCLLKELANCLEGQAQCSELGIKNQSPGRL